MHQMTLGQLRYILSQIGTGHDAKPIAVSVDSKVVNLDFSDVTVQGDRILFYSIPVPKQPAGLAPSKTLRTGLGWQD